MMTVGGYLTGIAKVKQFVVKFGIKRTRVGKNFIPELVLKSCWIDMDEGDWSLDLSGEVMSKFNVFLQNNLFGTKKYIND
jgi:hypothetical protein